RNHYKGDIVYCFEKEEVEVFYFRMLIKPIAHLFLKKLHIIFSKKPGERSQTIKKEGINVLIALNFVVLIVFRYPYQARCNFNIFVVSGDVCIGMMYNVMGNTPHIAVRAYKIKDQTQRFVYPGI